MQTLPYILSDLTVNGTALLVELALKSTVLLLFAALITLCVRKNSAARRHAIWFSALLGLLLLPLLTTVLPGFRVVPGLELVKAAATFEAEAHSTAITRQPGDSSPAAPDAERRMEQAPPAEDLQSSLYSAAREVSDGVPAIDVHEARDLPLSSPDAAASIGDRILQSVLWIWLVGFAAALLPLVFGYISIHRITRSLSPWLAVREREALESSRQTLDIRTPVRLLRGPRGLMPMTWGFGLQGPPTVILPAEAGEWSEDRLRFVLLHELAHVKRRDCLTQAIGRIICSLYWFHPLVWIAAARMVVEREQACDDIVLLHSGSPSAYAHDLVEVATDVDHRLPITRAAIAMARPRKLDTRLRAILDSGRNRAGITRRIALGLVLLTAAIALPVASLQWAATPEPLQADSSEPARVLDFRVVDKTSGAPLEGAEVRVYEGWDPREMVTDEYGRCRIERPESEFGLGVEVFAEGFVPVVVMWRVEPGRDSIPETYTLELEPAVQIGGRVVDENGAPISGATIFLHFQKRMEPPQQAIGSPPSLPETDSDGRWQFPNAPAEFEVFRMAVYHPDYATHTPGGGALPMESFSPVSALREGSAVHVLPHGDRLPIRILDAAGNPAAGATIGIGQARFGSYIAPERTANAEGRFLFPLHSDEDVILTIKHHGHAPELVRLPSNQRPEELVVRLEPANRLEGQVVDPDGMPVEGARVVIDSWREARTLLVRMATDAQGRFVWDAAPADEVLVDVLIPGYGDRRRVPMQAGAENRVVLPRPAVVRGLVVDAVTGDPIPRFSVTPGLYRGDSQTSWQDHDRGEYQAPDGRFEMNFTSDRDAYAVRVEADGYLAEESPFFGIPDGDQFFTFELHPAAPLTGRVVDRSGQPVAGAEVAVATPGRRLQTQDGRVTLGDLRAPVRYGSDAEGLFTIPPQSEPFFLVAIHDSGYAELADVMFVESGGEIILQPWARIEGRLWRDGRPAGRERIFGTRSQVEIQPDLFRSGFIGAVTDAEGHFQLDRVPPGEIEIGTRRVDDGLILQPTAMRRQLQPGETLRLAIGEGGRVVIGRFPLEGLELPTEWLGRVTLKRQANLPELPELDHGFSSNDLYFWDHAWMNTAAGEAFSQRRRTALAETLTYTVDLENDGSFQIEDVQPGSYTLEVAIHTRRSGRSFTFALPPIARATVDFTVPESDGSDELEPLVLPVLHPMQP